MHPRSSLAVLCAAVAFSTLACGKGELTAREQQPSTSTPAVPESLGPQPGVSTPTPAPTPAQQAPSTPTPSQPSTPTQPTASVPPPQPAPPTPAPTPTPTPTPTPAPPPPTAPQFSRVHWVSPSGNDASAGTEGAPFRTVAKALSVAQPGEAVFLKSGTYLERLKLEERGGSASKALTLKAAPGATPIIKGGSGSGSGTTMIDVRGAYWRIEGLTVDVAGSASFAVMWRGVGAHHGVLRGSTLKNGTAGAGANVAESASDILIEDNTISNFNRNGDDSHGVILQTTARNVVVRGNDIHHNSGDAVQCIGPEGGATLSGTPFDNLLVEDNDLHENRENGVDIKTCTRVTLRGNRIWGHHVSSTSKGEGVVVHLSARDVTLENNELYDNGRAINVGGVRVNAPPTNVVIRRNRLHDGSTAGEDEGSGIRVDTSVNVTVQHNTVWNMPGVCFIFGHGDSGPSQGMDARDNVFSGCGLAVRVGSGRSGAVVDGNLYSALSGAARFRLDGMDLDFTGWQGATRLDRNSLERAPGFMDAAGGDFRLAASSPARDAGVTLGGTFCGEGPDMGALEADCT